MKTTGLCIPQGDLLRRETAAWGSLIKDEFEREALAQDNLHSIQTGVSVENPPSML